MVAGGPTDGVDHGELSDETLQEEITLVGDLVVAATSAAGPLSVDEIDRLLGVTPGEDESSGH